jgi:NAD(P)-dependent dehydrogenase (short-subunit alcohol dehydrogenase family)
MLKNKVAVIYGAGGGIGRAVARAFAKEGPRFFSPGSTWRRSKRSPRTSLPPGAAEAAEVDALDEQAIDKHLQSVIDKAGRLDISFNAIAIPDAKILGVSLVELDAELFELPGATLSRIS